jgi:hypothetical protein
MYEEKARLGRVPELVYDAEGKMRRRIVQDELIEWAKAKLVKRDRPEVVALLGGEHGQRDTPVTPE